MGKPKVTERMLEDWIAEKLLEGPIEKGQGRGPGAEWRYSVKFVETALEILRLKGAKSRFAVVRLKLWLRARDIPIKRIRKDLDSEFRRLLHRQFFRNPLQYDANSRAKFGLRKLERERRRLGQTDPTLLAAAPFISDPAMLDAASELFRGGYSPLGIFRQLDQIMRTLEPFLGRDIIDSLMIDLRPFVAVGGLFGNPEEIENSGLSQLQNTKANDLEKGRLFFQRLLASARTVGEVAHMLPASMPPQLGAACEKFSRSLTETEEWPIACLAAFSIVAYRKRTGVNDNPNEN